MNIVSKKIVIIILCIITLLSNTASYITASSYETKDVIIYSSLQNERKRETLLLHNETIYMKLDSILKYTGYGWKYEKNGTVIQFSRSNKNVYVDIVKKELRYGEMKTLINDVINYEQEIWLPLDPLLLYLNARCEIANNEIIIWAADTTLHEYISKYQEMIESQLCMIGWEQHQGFFYDIIVALTVGLDIIFNEKIGAFLIGRYELNRHKRMLILVMESINQDLFDVTLQGYYADIVENSKLYKEMNQYEKIDVDEALQIIELMNLFDDATDILDHIDSVYSISEFNIDLVKDVVVNNDKYFGFFFHMTPLYRAAKEILTMYEKERTSPKQYLKMIIEKGVENAFEEVFEEGIKPFLNSYFMAFIGLKIFVTANEHNEKYDNFLMLKDMYLFQERLEKAQDMLVAEVISNAESISTSKIDFIYNCGLLYIQIRNASDKILSIDIDKVKEVYKDFLAIDKKILYFDDVNYLSNFTVTYNDIINMNFYEGMHDWVGKYEEYYTFNYSDYSTGKPKKNFSSNIYESRYIPYIQLNVDGTYEFYLNFYEGMYLLSGTWVLDDMNENMAYLLEAKNEYGEILYDKLLLEKVENDKIVFRGADKLKPREAHSTTVYGNVYINKNFDKGSIVENEKYNTYDWARIYLDSLETIYKTIGITGVLLYDSDGDRIPELFIRGLGDWNDFIYVYSIKDSKLLYQTNVHFGKITIREDLKNQSEKMFISSLWYEQRGEFCLFSMDVNLNNISPTIVFRQSAGKELHVYDQKVDEDIYDQEMKDFENKYVIQNEISLYDITIYDYNSYMKGREDFVNILNSYILN